MDVRKDRIGNHLAYGQVRSRQGSGLVSVSSAATLAFNRPSAQLSTPCAVMLTLKTAWLRFFGRIAWLVVKSGFWHPSALT
jgi:hypothetical protein